MLTDKTILIIGAGGSLGTVTIEEILKHNPKKIIAYDNHEHAIFELEQKFKYSDKIEYMLADILDQERLDYATKYANIVLVFSAVKHVHIGNYSPEQCIQTNVIGTLNAYKSAMKSEHVEKFVYMSSDKAVDPTSLYGCTKLLPEFIIQHGENIVHHPGKIAYTIRFGNFFGSKGSVVPKWRELIKQGKPITLTHPEMRRFMMPLKDVAKFVFDSLDYAKDGEVIVPKMKVVRIKDLADVMSDNQIITEPEPGEKIDELLEKEISSVDGELFTKEEIKAMLDEC